MITFGNQSNLVIVIVDDILNIAVEDGMRLDKFAAEQKLNRYLEVLTYLSLLQLLGKVFAFSLFIYFARFYLPTT
jgi:hypothetical protein